MYLRLMKLKMLPGKFAEIEFHYRERVLPSLERTPGCLCATLTEDVGEGVCISLTLWEDRDSIRRYEEGGTFEDLIEGVQRWLANSSEWRFQLNERLQLEYGPAKEEPTIRSYDMMSSRDDIMCDNEASGAYLRLLRINVTPDRAEAFRQAYRENAIPKLQAVKGCRFASLLSNLNAKNQLVSMTLWDSREDAEAYERSSIFQEMLQNARDILGADRWDLAMASNSVLVPSRQGGPPTAKLQIVEGRHFQTRSVER